MEKSRAFDKITHYFPIRGHSFMPPDRIFGRIKQKLRKIERIVSPGEYHTILGDYGTLKKWGKDWQVRDFKSMSKTILKSTLPVTLQEQKVIMIDRVHKRQVGFQTAYSSEPIFVNLLKPKSKFGCHGQSKVSSKGKPSERSETQGCCKTDGLL